MSSELEYLPSLLPVQFFNIECEIKKGLRFGTQEEKRAFQLPSFHDLLSEEHSHKAYMQYDNSSLRVLFECDFPFQTTSVKNFTKEDSIEIYLVTNNLDHDSIHPYVHHLLLFPSAIEGIHLIELTKFRGVAQREIITNDMCSVNTTLATKNYSVELEIPCIHLHGMNNDTKQLAFGYTINRYKGDRQHFSLSSNAMSVVNHPSRLARVTFGTKKRNLS